MHGHVQSRDAHVRKVLLVALCVNLLGWAVKFFWGYWTKSISMQADALHALFDAVSSIVAWAGILLAARSSSPRHADEHSRFESMAAIGISIFIFIGCVEIVIVSLHRFQEMTLPNVTPASFLIMLATMAMNAGLSQWEGRMGHLLHSPVLGADALHTKTDLYASIGVIISLVAGFIGYPLIDPLAALAIAGLIGYGGTQILRHNINALIREKNG